MDNRWPPGSREKANPFPLPLLLPRTLLRFDPLRDSTWRFFSKFRLECETNVEEDIDRDIAWTIDRRLFAGRSWRDCKRGEGCIPMGKYSRVHIVRGMLKG